MMVFGLQHRVGGGGVTVLPMSQDWRSFFQLQSRRGFPQFRLIVRYEEFGQEWRDLWCWVVCLGDHRHWRWWRLVVGIVCWRWWRLVVMVVWCWMMLSDVSVILHLCVIAVIIRSVSHNLIINVFTRTRGKSVNLSPHSVSAVHCGNKLNATRSISVKP